MVITLIEESIFEVDQVSMEREIGKGIGIWGWEFGIADYPKFDWPLTLDRGPAIGDLLALIDRKFPLLNSLLPWRYSCGLCQFCHMYNAAVVLSCACTAVDI